MTLEDLKDQVRERATEIWDRIQESPAYNNLREKYETLSPGAQKGLQLAAIGIVVLTLASIPYSYLSTSSDYVAEFENSRSLIRSLLRASRLASEASTVPSAMSGEELKSQLQSQMSTYSLLPEQIGGVIDLDTRTLGNSLAPRGIQQQGIGLSLKKLNLKQVTDIGYQLQGLNPSIKMAGLEVTASTPDPHYFDVLYKFVIYSMPGAASDASDKTAPGPRGGSRGNSRSDSQDEDQEDDE